MNPSLPGEPHAHARRGEIERGSLSSHRPSRFASNLVCACLFLTCISSKLYAHVSCFARRPRRTAALSERDRHEKNSKPNEKTKHLGSRNARSFARS
jgi:hypothetical protein